MKKKEWAEVDSNHRRLRQQIYSLPPLATRVSAQKKEKKELELEMGIEPATC